MRRFLWLFPLLCLAGFGQPAPNSLKIPRVGRPPTLEEFLHGTPPGLAISDFRQFMPGDMNPASQPTVAYLSYDDKNLYVGWICKDDPRLIRARIAKRKDIESDDRVTINIDTFHDHKHAYWFDVNPYGIQFDGITTDGQGDDRSWEGLWYTDGRLTEDGYVVLETIPFRSLRFPAGDKQVWGVSLARFIYRANEFSTWPAITRQKAPQYVGQFGDMEIDGGISPGRNMQVIPYGSFSAGRGLDDTQGFSSRREAVGGLDARVVLKDAFTLDLTANPDFSQVESDEPQVMVNQRYEVFFPEKRPFFMEKASLFNTPEMLFFSRRIADPQFGARLTGTVGRWSLGVLAADDQAPGRLIRAGERWSGSRARDAVARVERGFGRQSHIGATLTTYDFGASYNRVASLDTRIGIGPNWALVAQAASSATRYLDGSRLAGPDYLVSLRKSGRNSSFRTSYVDRSPAFRAQLGYIPRVDIREWSNAASYTVRPRSGALIGFGPSLSQSVAWNRQGRLRDWSVAPGANFELRRATYLSVAHSRTYELYRNLGFRRHATSLSLSTEWFRWLAARTDCEWGTAINYYPAANAAPLLGRDSRVSAGLTFRATARLRFDESYDYSRLAALPDRGAASHPLFNNHIVRSKVYYQFNRELSLRAILDYNSVIPNPHMVSLDNSRRAAVDVLLTYLLHPGTALYIGYLNAHENLAFDPLRSPALYRTDYPGAITGHQIFAKISYLLRF
jgi:hypothetical protein